MNRLTRMLGWAVVAGTTMLHDGGEHLHETTPSDLTLVDHQVHAYTCATHVVQTGSTCMSVTIIG
jgi:hypothetical protein